ncbi:hypothetical protein I6Y99_004418 [Vibrio parahaemolyticus]|nr:hypothetical protein [Vibrio parahaemolyticus]
MSNESSGIGIGQSLIRAFIEEELTEMTDKELSILHFAMEKLRSGDFSSDEVDFLKILHDIIKESRLLAHGEESPVTIIENKVLKEQACQVDPYHIIIKDDEANAFITLCAEDEDPRMFASAWCLWVLHEQIEVELRVKEEVQAFETGDKFAPAQSK